MAVNGSRVTLDNGRTTSNEIPVALNNAPIAINGTQAMSNGTSWTSYSSYAVLGGVLVASFIFKFPLFCFFCPIGLFFGAFYAAVRYFSLDSFGLELLFFPAMLVLELYVLKSWCRSICPLGALLSLAGNLNRFLVPTPNRIKCFRSKGVECKVCLRACPEGIDPMTLGKRFAPNSCTKCLECYVRCPAKAVKFSLRA
jgi:ferredoxin-type protein NapH